MVGETITLVGTYPPRRCGIATFTEDLGDAIAMAFPGQHVNVIAMTDAQSYGFSPRVAAAIQQDDLAGYEAAADALNARGCSLVCVQHEFGIFGGLYGSYLLAFLRRVRAPIVTTLHTVLERFTSGQLAVVEELALLSTKLVVMSERACSLLVAQGVPREKIDFVPHGIPNIRADREREKARMGLEGRDLVLTFGLLSPNKGIETAIRALPTLVAERPQALYLVLGATHPHIRRKHGEIYRESLVALAAELGLSGNVRFIDTYSDLDGISRAIAAADVCLLPYANREQITSGTLAYAFGNGKAVVATPFWHAEELLAEGRGVLTPFGDVEAMGVALRDLVLDSAARASMEERARARGQRMFWPEVARAYGEIFVAVSQPRKPAMRLPRPAIRLDHVAALSDDTGLLQHAVIAVPNLHEGYTTDDNARCLHLAALCPADPKAAAIARRTLAFMHHAFNPESRRFRNFMSYDRHWLDEDGGDNVQARAVRALVAARVLPGALGRTAGVLLDRSLVALEDLTWPRAQSIALIAIADLAVDGPVPSDLHARAHGFAANLRRLRATVATPAWPWFEPTLSYSNAKLPHGLIAYGDAFADASALDEGLETLRWLDAQQTAPDGSFLPIGSERPYAVGEARPFWDGQPIEVYAAVAASLAAHRATADAAWLASARRALDWLLGRNSLGLPLYDSETGGCRDGLHRDRRNENQGAESTLALWLSLAEYEGASALALTTPAETRPVLQTASTAAE